MQLLTLSMFIFSLACMNLFYPYNRGGLYTALIVLYALTAGIAGYVGASYYKQVGAPGGDPALKLIGFGAHTLRTSAELHSEPHSVHGQPDCFNCRTSCWDGSLQS